MAIKWTSLGTHLERTISVTVVTSLVDEPIEVSSATVLLVFSRDYAASEIGKRLLQLAIASCPLAIAVAGAGADAAFDDLLKTTSDSSYSRHIMTARLDEDSHSDMVESFLFGVIPAEERFDEWKVVNILLVEDFNNCYQRIVEAISKWVDEGER